METSDEKLKLLLATPLVYNDQVMEYLDKPVAEVKEFCRQKQEWWDENLKRIKESRNES